MNTIAESMKLRKSSNRMKSFALRGYELTLILVGAALTLTFTAPWWVALIVALTAGIVSGVSSWVLRMSVKKFEAAYELYVAEYMRRMGNPYEGGTGHVANTHTTEPRSTSP